MSSLLNTIESTILTNAARIRNLQRAQQLLYDASNAETNSHSIAAVELFTHANELITEPCGYCGSSDDPNDMCITCWNGMQGQPESPHTDMCQEYWDRGLECQCIPFAVAQDIRDSAHPEDVM